MITALYESHNTITERKKKSKDIYTYYTLVRVEWYIYSELVCMLFVTFCSPPQSQQLRGRKRATASCWHITAQSHSVLGPLGLFIQTQHDWLGWGPTNRFPCSALKHSSKSPDVLFMSLPIYIYIYKNKVTIIFSIYIIAMLSWLMKRAIDENYLSVRTWIESILTCLNLKVASVTAWWWSVHSVGTNRLRHADIDCQEDSHKNYSKFNSCWRWHVEEYIDRWVIVWISQRRLR